MSLLSCPLCKHPETQTYVRQSLAGYWCCPLCSLVFADPSLLPDRASELAHYQQHRNRPDDPGYRRFLNRLASPLLERLKPGLQGLDYGCGPGPALAAMFTEAGQHMSLYDPFFHDDPEALQRQYDFICCTEVVEHFHDPAAGFERLHSLLKPGGWLGIMTMFCPEDDSAFPNWHYRLDPTHVVFYRPATFCHLASRFGWQGEFPGHDVVLFCNKEQ